MNPIVISTLSDDDRILLRTDEEDIAAIRLSVMRLQKESASEFWKSFISRRFKPMFRFLPPTHWSLNVIEGGPDWEVQWNTPVQPDQVLGFLNERIDWHADQHVYIVKSGNAIYYTSWEICKDYWRIVLNAIDSLIVIIPGSQRFVYFGETGPLYLGERPILEPFDNSDYEHLVEFRR